MSDSESATLYAEAINTQKPGFGPALQELHRLEVCYYSLPLRAVIKQRAHLIFLMLRQATGAHCSDLLLADSHTHNKYLKSIDEQLRLRGIGSLLADSPASKFPTQRMG